MITDADAAGVGIVATAEEMAVNESAELAAGLDEAGVALDEVFVNGLYPERFSAAELDRIRAAREQLPSAALDAAVAEAERARTQRVELGRLRERRHRRADPRAAVPVLRRLRLRGARAARRGARMSAHLETILAGRSICICAGSGGVGKTTTSAAIAVAMAEHGLKVAVLTIDPAKRLADSLGLAELGNVPRRVDLDGGDGGGELWAMMLDAKATFDEVIDRYSPDAQARQRILDNRIYQQISGALAGSQEYMAMEKLYEIDSQGGFDLLVLDTPPSRNALDFLDAPRRVTQFVEGRAMRLFIRPTGFGARIAGRGFAVVSSVLRRVTGGDLIADLSEFFSAMAGLLGGFRERAERVEGLLGDERTTFLIVTGPAGEPIKEASYLRSKLAAAELPLGAMIVNRVHTITGTKTTEGSAREDLGTALGDEDLVSRVLAAHADRQLLAGRDRRNIDELRSRSPGVPVFEVPELSDEVHDLGGLRAFARLLMPEEPG